MYIYHIKMTFMGVISLKKSYISFCNFEAKELLAVSNVTDTILDEGGVGKRGRGDLRKRGGKLELGEAERERKRNNKSFIKMLSFAIRGGEGIVCLEELGEQGLGICVFPHRPFHPPVYPCW